MDPVDVFLTVKGVLTDFQQGKGCVLGKVPACVSVTDGIRDEDEEEREKDETEEALWKLQRVLRDEVPHSYCCGGSIPIASLVSSQKGVESIGMDIKKWDNIHVFTTDNLLELDSAALKKQAVASGFGDLSCQQTRVDEQVRKAFEIQADYVVLFGVCTEKKNGKPLVNCSVFSDRRFESRIEKLLTNNPVQINFHKLNLYEEGGFFQPHVDTPTHGSRFLGTLVVCLPSKHSGGELVVRHAGHSQTFDFGPDSEDCLQWCAFYGDCVHEVKPVTSGTRITLTYHILEYRPSWKRAHMPLLPLEKRIQQPVDMSSHYIRSLEAALSQVQQVLPRQDNELFLGLLLAHRYPLDICSNEAGLKGKDAVLYRYLKKHYTVRIQTVIHSESLSYIDSPCMETDRHSCVYRFTQADYDALRVSPATAVPASDLPNSIVFVPVVGKEHVMLSHEQEGAEFAGNEAMATSIDVVYYDAALVIQLVSPKRQRTE